MMLKPGADRGMSGTAPSTGARLARTLAVALVATVTFASIALAARPRGLELVISAQTDGARILSVPAAAGDVLVFEWIHSVEHFPWYEYFDVLPDGSLFLRETRIGGFGAGVPFERGTSARIEDGFIVYRGIDETYPSYRWINSTTAVAAITLDGMIVAHGSDFPHHEALELRVTPRRYFLE